jgi:hypothetical protein
MLKVSSCHWLLRTDRSRDSAKSIVEQAALGAKGDVEAMNVG